MFSNRVINREAAFIADNEPAMETIGGWQDARVAHVVNAAGTVYLVIVTKEETTYYPLVPK